MKVKVKARDGAAGPRCVQGRRSAGTLHTGGTHLQEALLYARWGYAGEDQGPRGWAIETQQRATNGSQGNQRTGLLCIV